MPYYEKRKKAWRAVVKGVGGKRRTRLFQTKGEAKTWEVEERKQTKGTQTDTTLLELSNRYLDEAKEFSKKTYDEKRLVFRKLLAKWGNINIYLITPPMVLEYLNERKAEVSGNAANKDRKNLLAFFGWCGKIYGILHNPVANIQPRRHKKTPRRIVPLGDILRLIQAAEGQNRIMLESYWHTG
ncbi:MAG: hypothetical protein ACFFCW_36190, partial [Candidatus Hodarchaeota archaeon]